MGDDGIKGGVADLEAEPQTQNHRRRTGQNFSF